MSNNGKHHSMPGQCELFGHNDWFKCNKTSPLHMHKTPIERCIDNGLKCVINTELLAPNISINECLLNPADKPPMPLLPKI
jgi:hypothetical protein